MKLFVGIGVSSTDLETVVINPKETKRYHDIFEENKNDKLDAFYIADYLRIGHYR